MTTAVWFTLQAMTSGYFLVFSAVAMVASAAVRPDAWFGPRARRTLGHAGLAAVLAGVLLLPTLWPYWRVRTDAGLVRPISEVAKYSASWTDYLATGGRLHFAAWSRPYFRADALFPGVVALLLVGASVAAGTAWRDRRARMCLATTAAGVVLSFGPAFPPYEWLYQTVPLIQGVRGAARFGHLALVALAAVAGFGAADVLRRVRSDRWRAVLGAVLVAAVTGEALRAPLAFAEFKGIPAVYDTLARYDGAVLVHFPMFSRKFVHANSAYMLGSTRHWHPMLNGFSGFIPASYGQNGEALGGFPDDRSLDHLRKLGVTHVVVHEKELPPDRSARARQTPALRLLTEDGPVRVYALLR